MFFPKKKKMQKFPFFFVFRSKIGWKMKNNLKKLALKKKLVFVFWNFFLSKHSFRSVCFIFGTIGRTKSFKSLQKSQNRKFPPEVSARAKFWDFPPGAPHGGLRMYSPYVAVYRLLQPLAFSGFTKNNFEKWRETKLKKMEQKKLQKIKISTNLGFNKCRFWNFRFCKFIGEKKLKKKLKKKQNFF